MLNFTKLCIEQLSTVSILDYKDQMIHYSYTRLKGEYDDAIDPSVPGTVCLGHYLYCSFLYDILPQNKLKIFNTVRISDQYKYYDEHKFRNIFDIAWFFIRDIIKNISNTMSMVSDFKRNDKNKSLVKQAKNLIRKTTQDIYKMQQLLLPKCLQF